MDLGAIRYPRVVDALQAEYKKERNTIYEIFQLLSRKQQINESLEQFHSVLSGLASRCNFGTLEDRNLRDVFIVNMNNREAQYERCRSTKTPEEVYKIVLSYERGNLNAKSYVSTNTGGGTSSTPSGGSLKIKQEPVGIIRGGNRNPRQRGRGSHCGRGFARGGRFNQTRKCYNCDQPVFTPEHMSKCPAKNVISSHCRKIGHFERACRSKNTLSRGRGGVHMIQEEDGELLDYTDNAEDGPLELGNSVGWVDQDWSNVPAQLHSWDSDSSGDYVNSIQKGYRAQSGGIAVISKD